MRGPFCCGMLASLNMEPVSQAEVEAKGEEIFAIVDAKKVLPDALNPAVWYGRAMEWSMGNEALKVQTLRFVDVLPALNSSGSVVEHMQEYFSGQEGALAGPMKLGLGMSKMAPWLVGPTIKKSVGGMARQFITGRTGAEAVPVLRKIRARNVGFTVDILGEAVVSEREADEYYHRYLELIESLAAEAKGWAHSEQLEGGANGQTMPKVNVSVKISALYSQIHPADPEGAIAHLKDKLRPLFRRAQELGVFINLDMENYGLKNLTLSLFESLLDEPEFTDYHDAGLVIQAYLRDASDDIERLIAWAKARSRRITIRLVKGAYWDYETVMARQRGWPIPVYLKKPESDANYRALHPPDAGGARADLFRLRHAQRPQHGPRDHLRRKARAGPPRLRDPDALRDGRADQEGARAARTPHPRVLPHRRDAPRHGLPRAAAARKHLQRGFSQGEIHHAGRLQGTAARSPHAHRRPGCARTRHPARTACRQRRPAAARPGRRRGGCQRHERPTSTATTNPNRSCPSPLPTNPRSISRSKTAAGRCGTPWQPSARRSARSILS